MIPLPFSFDDNHYRLSRDTTQVRTNVLNDLIYTFTGTPPLRTRKILTFFHLSYIDRHSFLVETPDEHSFSIHFISPLNSVTTIRNHNYPTSFHFFPQNSLRLNNLLPQLTTSSDIQAFLRKESVFNLSNTKQYRSIENKPHYLLRTDILTLSHLQYHFFRNLTVNTRND